MVHRVHKAAVASTNKQVLQRDLTARDNLMQGLRFSVERTLHDDSALGELIDAGVFSDVYFERKEDLVMAPDLMGEDDDEASCWPGDRDNGQSLNIVTSLTLWLNIARVDCAISVCV